MTPDIPPSHPIQPPTLSVPVPFGHPTSSRHHWPLGTPQHGSSSAWWSKPSNRPKKKPRNPRIVELKSLFFFLWGGGGRKNASYPKKTMVFTIYLTLLPTFFVWWKNLGPESIESVTPTCQHVKKCPMVPCSQANCKCNPHLLHRSTHRCHLPKAPWEAKTLHQLDQTAKIADHL